MCLVLSLILILLKRFNIFFLYRLFIFKACQGVDGIFHLAGLVIHSRLEENSKKVYETNLLGTMNILKAAHTQKYFSLL